MKNRLISPIIITLIGILIILIPTVLFPVCDSGEMKMACYYTKQAEIGIGIAVILTGITALVLNDKKIRIGLSISLIYQAALVLLFPFKLLGLCKMSDMDCRVKSSPAFVVIGIVLAIAAAADLIYLTRSKKD